MPLSPYGASKLAGEGYLRTWASAYGQQHAVLRLGNVYGPRQSPHGEAGVVAIFSHRLLAGETLTLFGDGAPTRDYVHVADVVRAFLAATGRPGTFNVGTGVETATHQLLRHLQDGGRHLDVAAARAAAGGRAAALLPRPGPRARGTSAGSRRSAWPRASPSTFRWFAEESATATTSAA